MITFSSADDVLRDESCVGIVDGRRNAQVHNWGSYSTGELAITFCPDCDDPCLVEKGDSRCETCKQYDADTAAAMMRTHAVVALGELYRPLYEKAGLLKVRPEAGPMIASLRAIPYSGRGSMNDERVAFCSFCGDPGVTYPGDMIAEQIDGKRCECESCKRPGTVRMHDDEGSCWVTFEADR